MGETFFFGVGVFCKGRQKIGPFDPWRESPSARIVSDEVFPNATLVGPHPLFSGLKCYTDHVTYDSGIQETTDQNREKVPLRKQGTSRKKRSIILVRSQSFLFFPVVLPKRSEGFAGVSISLNGSADPNDSPSLSVYDYMELQITCNVNHR